MNYEEKYKEALEGIQEILDSGEDSIKMSRLQLRLQGIFPELKESEDEKIRKWIVDDITFNMNNEPLNNSEYRKKAEKAIAWLEKQGEKDILEDAILDSNEDGLIAETIRYKHEKQGGQKPTWSKENGVKDNWEYIQDFIGKLGHFPKDSDELDVLINYVLNEKQRSAKWSEKDRSKVQRICKYLNEAKKYYADITEVRECMDWLKSLQNKVQPKQEWNKEDEVGFGDALWAIKQARTIAKDENDMGNLWCAERWLKSLKGRVQPKQEWSEEDKDYYDAIIAKLEVTQEDASLTNNQMDFLKSLRPQKCLIPSEEEIEKAAQEWDSKANFNPFYMTMENGKPTGVKQSITTHKESFKAGVNWILKSFKPQNAWKPSDKQMNVLWCHCSENSVLTSLYNDLKKLKDS